MAFCRVVFPLLVLSVISCYASNVPVIIWGDFAGSGSSIKANPLTTVDSEDFSSFLSEKLEDVPVTVVFQDKTLSVEDFSSRNDDGQTSYPFLHGNIKKAIYLPSVKSPLHELHLLAKGHRATTLRVTENGLSKDLPTEISDSGSYIFIDFEDAKEGESRWDFLRRHDEIMNEIVKKMQERYGNIVAIYTAKYPSWVIADPPVTHSRVRRDAAASDVYNFDYLLMKVKNISLMSKNATWPLTTILKHNSTLNETTLNVDLEFENVSLALNFNLKGGYWFFNSVTFENGSLVEELQPVGEQVFAIDGFSYRCAQYVKFASVNQSNDYTLNFENLKIQPFFAESNNTEFGDSFNCVGFFTAPIWAGLFVVFILLSITFYGIMMMMDIRTMDRFDDPKGKTITINAAE